MTNEYRWQAPGNGRIFDAYLNDLENSKDIKMSQRSIGVLRYIEENVIVSKNRFEKEIADYLQNKFKHIENKSTKCHFYRPLEFVGLIRNINDNISLSIDGRNFLKEIENKNYDKALDFYILQMLKTKYPNTATKDVKLNLFPFRILFKLLLDYGSIETIWFETKIPYISKIEDIYNIQNIEKNEYSKWRDWVISGLKALGILVEKNKKISISENKIDYIKSFVNDMKYEEMFFDSGINEIYTTNNIKHIRRDNTLIYDVIKDNNFNCFFNKNHKTFSTNNRPNYVEGHHIIPISLQDSFPNYNLDIKDNIIPLCPNCHRKIHLATNECKIDCLNDIFNNTNIKDIFNVSLEDLKEIYFSNVS